MNKFTVLAGVSAAITTTAATMAGPLLSITANVGGYAPVTSSSNGTSTSTAGSYSYVGGMFSGLPMDWMISWDLLGEDVSVNTGGTFVTNGFRVQNLTGSSKTFDITVLLSTPGPSNLTLQCTGLIGAMLVSDAAGSTATLTSTGPLWMGQINGEARPTSGLMNDVDLSTTSTTNLTPPASSWNGTISQPLSSVGYRMQFTLGAKSTAVFSGYWDGVVVPTPGALATLVVAGGLANRRRRTN
jgi:hypothetical protein